IGGSIRSLSRQTGNFDPAYRAVYGHFPRVKAYEVVDLRAGLDFGRSEEHTSELQSLMRISYAVFCLKKKTYKQTTQQTNSNKQQHNPINNTDTVDKYTN